MPEKEHTAVLHWNSLQTHDYEIWMNSVSDNGITENIMPKFHINAHTLQVIPRRKFCHICPRTEIQ